MSDGINNKVKGAGVHTPHAGDVLAHGEAAAGSKRREGGDGDASRVDWSARLAGFRRLTAPLADKLTQLTQSAIVVRDHARGGKASPGSTWIFDNPKVGRAFFEGWMSAGARGLNKDYVDDYVHVLAKGIDVKPTKRHSLAAKALRELLPRDPQFDYVKIFEDAYQRYDAKERTELIELIKETDAYDEEEYFEYNDGVVREMVDDPLIKRQVYAVQNELDDREMALSEGAAAKGKKSDIDYHAYAFERSLREDVTRYVLLRLVVDRAERKRQKRLESLIERGLELIAALSPVGRQVVKTFRRGKKVSVSMIVDPEREPNSYSARTIDQIFDRDHAYANQVRIRRGARIDELFHEIVHSVPQESLPAELKLSKPPPRLNPDDTWPQFKAALEADNNASESRAFAGNAILRKEMRDAGFGDFPPMEGHPVERLIALAHDGGPDAVYREINRAMPQYHRHGIGNAWKIGLHVKASRLPRHRWASHIVAQDAQGWGIYTEKPWEGRGAYRVNHIDLDRVIDRAAGIDPNNLLRLAESLYLDGAVMTGGEVMPPPDILVSPADVPVRRNAPPAGDPAEIGSDPDASVHRVALLSSFEAMYQALPETELPKLEAALVAAEYAEAGDAAKHYRTAYDALQIQTLMRLYGSAVLMRARIGASLTRTGTIEEGRTYLRDAADYFLMPDAIAKAAKNDDQVKSDSYYNEIFESFNLSRPQLVEIMIDDYIASGMSSELLATVRSIMKNVSFEKRTFEMEVVHSHATSNLASLVRIIAHLRKGGGLTLREQTSARHLMRMAISDIYDYRFSVRDVEVYEFVSAVLDLRDNALDPWLSEILDDLIRIEIRRHDDSAPVEWSTLGGILAEALPQVDHLSASNIKMLTQVCNRLALMVRHIRSVADKTDEQVMESHIAAIERDRLDELLWQFYDFPLADRWNFACYKSKYAGGIEQFLSKHRMRATGGTPVQLGALIDVGVRQLTLALTLLDCAEPDIVELARAIVEDIPAGKPFHVFALTGAIAGVLHHLMIPDYDILGPMGRLARYVRGEPSDERPVPISAMDLKALALIRLAAADADSAKKYLAEAESLVIAADEYEGEDDPVFEPSVRLEYYPEVMLKINVLTRLRDAYLTVAGDLEAAERVHEVLNDYYVQDLARSIQKQAIAFVDIARAGNVRLSDELGALAAEVEHKPHRFSPLAIELNFDALKAAYSARSGDIERAREMLTSLKDRVEVKRDGGQVDINAHYSIADLMKVVGAIGGEPALADHASAFARLITAASADARGTAHEVYHSGEGRRRVRGPWLKEYRAPKKSGTAWRDALDPRRAQLEKMGGSFLDDEVTVTSERFLLAEGHLSAKDLDVGGERRGLAAVAADFVATLEAAALADDMRERLYIEMVGRMMPSRVDNWAELIERAPESLEPFRGVMDGGRYPNLERFILERLAHAARQVRFDPERTAANSGAASALTAIARDILGRHPELARPEHLGHMLEISQDHEHLVALRRLFPDQIEPALRGMRTDRIGGFSYGLGDIVVGAYDVTRAAKELAGVLKRFARSAPDVHAPVSLTTLRIAKEMLRREVIGADDPRPILSSLHAWFEQHAVSSFDASAASFIARTLFMPRDQDEARGLSSLATNVIARRVEGGEVFPELEHVAMEILYAAGMVSRHTFNLHLNDAESWDDATRNAFFSWVQQGLVYSRQSVGAPSDIVTALVFRRQTSENYLTKPLPDDAADATQLHQEMPLESYERFAAWIEGAHALNTSFRRPMDVLLYHELYADRQQSRGKVGIPFDEFIDLVKRRSSAGGSQLKATRHIAVWEEMLKYFPHPASEGLTRGRSQSAFHVALDRLKEEHRAAREQISLTAFNVPRVFRDMPPAIRFAVTRYFVDLPLGERENILRDFEGGEVSQEQALKLFFEKTGNEKLAQFLSLMKGVVPEQQRQLFATFRDEVSGSSPEEVALELDQAYGLAPDDLFAHFERAMYKSGTIGEIYRGTIRAGTVVRNNGERMVIDEDREVIVKILTRARQARIETNLARLNSVARELTRAGGRFMLRFDPEDIAREFERTVRDEMDFKREISNAREYAEILPEGVVTPEYYENISRPNILVMSRVAGVAFDEVGDVNVKRTVADRLGAMLARHILIDGLFHDDLHPKNIFVDGETISLIDFGRLGRLDAEHRAYIVMFIEKLATWDVAEIAQALMRLVRHSATWANRAELERAIERIISGAGFEEMVGVTDRIFAAAAHAGFTLDAVYVQAVKALMTLEASVREDERLEDFSMSLHVLGAVPAAMESLGRREDPSGSPSGSSSGSGSNSTPSSPAPGTPSAPLSAPLSMGGMQYMQPMMPMMIPLTAPLVR